MGDDSLAHVSKSRGSHSVTYCIFTLFPSVRLKIAPIAAKWNPVLLGPEQQPQERVSDNISWVEGQPCWGSSSSTLDVRMENSPAGGLYDSASLVPGWKGNFDGGSSDCTPNELYPKVGPP